MLRQHRHPPPPLLLLLLLVVVGLSGVCGDVVVHHEDDHSLCSHRPVCEDPRRSTGFRLQYCYTFTSTLVGWWSHARRWLQAPTNPFTPASTHTPTDDHRRAYELPLASDARWRREVLQELADLLSTRLMGQAHLHEPLFALLRRKMQYPDEPLVLHFAGDHGVGKTLTAQLISLATSLHCDRRGRTSCASGDNLLTIAGTSFDGMALEDARRYMVRQVLHHARRYPHGIVLIDDFSAMDPSLARILAPLFGRSDRFPEQEDHGGGATQRRQVKKQLSVASSLTRPHHSAPPDAMRNDEAHHHDHHHGVVGGPSTSSLWELEDGDRAVHLRTLTVILTTDLGQHGRTIGKTPAELQQLLRREFSELYGSLTLAHTRDLLFLPLHVATAELVVRTVVEHLPCEVGEAALAGASISNEAVAFLVERERPTWEARENARALVRVVEDELLSQVLLMRDAEGYDRRIYADFVLDSAAAKVRLVPRGDTSTQSWSSPSSLGEL